MCKDKSYGRERGHAVELASTDVAHWCEAEEWLVVIMMLGIRGCSRGKREEYVCLGDEANTEN